MNDVNLELKINLIIGSHSRRKPHSRQVIMYASLFIPDV